MLYSLYLENYIDKRSISSPIYRDATKEEILGWIKAKRNKATYKAAKLKIEWLKFLNDSTYIISEKTSDGDKSSIRLRIQLTSINKEK